MLTVLIVDDHPHLVESLTLVIPWQDYGVGRMLTAYSGPEALETIRREPVDMMITDIRMPGMSGLELIEAARSHRPKIGCILLTGYAEFDYARKAVELQTFRYLLKPVRPDELAACVRELAVALAGRDAGRQSRLGAGSRYAAGAEGEATGAEGHGSATDGAAYGSVGSGAPNGTDGEAERSGNGRVVDAVHAFVHRHLDGDLSLTAIADHVHLHPVYLSKLYKESTGANLSDYILATRMEKAKELLRHSPLKIYEICAAVGYRSTQHFITEFKKAAGATPKQYRDA